MKKILKRRLCSYDTVVALDVLVFLGFSKQIQENVQSTKNLVLNLVGKIGIVVGWMNTGSLGDWSLASHLRLLIDAIHLARIPRC